MVTFMLLHVGFRRKIDTRFHCAKANSDELKWLYLFDVAHWSSSNARVAE
jgi:hypothetical protein